MEFKLVGMDECGRGALAGLLVAGAVLIAGDKEEIVAKSPAPIRDSKQLTRLQREKLVDYFSLLSIKVELEIAAVAEINQKGIGWVNKAVFQRLFQKLVGDEYIVDGNLKLGLPHCESRIRADQSVLEVQIASIFAKVYRDKLMRDLHKEFPFYGWDHNVGYGTPHHRQALAEHGGCHHHRLKFIDRLFVSSQ